MVHSFSKFHVITIGTKSLDLKNINKKVAVTNVFSPVRLLYDVESACCCCWAKCIGCAAVWIMFSLYTQAMNKRVNSRFLLIELPPTVFQTLQRPSSECGIDDKLSFALFLICFSGAYKLLHFSTATVFLNSVALNCCRFCQFNEDFSSTKAHNTIFYDFSWWKCVLLEMCIYCATNQHIFSTPLICWMRKSRNLRHNLKSQILVIKLYFSWFSKSYLYYLIAPKYASGTQREVSINLLT